MSACDLCKLQGLEAGIPKAAKPAEQVCFQNRAAGPGGCVHPEPAVHFRLAGLWRVFAIAQSSFRRGEMSGIWERPEWSEIESIARGCGEPWDTLTMERVAVLLSGFADRLPKPKQNPKK